MTNCGAMTRQVRAMTCQVRAIGRVIARTWRVEGSNFIVIAPDYYFKERKFIKIARI